MNLIIDTRVLRVNFDFHISNSSCLSVPARLVRSRMSRLSTCHAHSTRSSHSKDAINTINVHKKKRFEHRIKFSANVDHTVKWFFGILSAEFSLGAHRVDFVFV